MKPKKSARTPRETPGTTENRLRHVLFLHRVSRVLSSRGQ
ncbi:hypothetical protein PUN28_014141 [Cardiocondyla obscurior]|uniref:Uncharacterized protein n=1 Tax=Cardiocondyla obscurior TaxID=286306 RepID=A0AAW2F099_9HYME